MTSLELAALEKRFGVNKTFPVQYQVPILKALACYPELQEVRIRFNQARKHPVPYGTTPSSDSFFKAPRARTYDITILEEAPEPERSALFCNLPVNQQTAVIAHELIHVLQFHSCSQAQLMGMLLLYPFPFFKRKVERGADEGAIQRGFGEFLYEHALHLRSIPGYTAKRPEINRYYLKPDEILRQLEKMKVAA